MIKHRLTLCLLTALVFLCNAVLLFNPSKIAEAANGYQIMGDSVVTSTTLGDIMVTPHTLSSSGWVRVDFQSKSFTGDIDISFGFNGTDQVQTTKGESWENYEHTLTRQVDAILTSTFKPDKVKSVKDGSLNTPVFGTKGLNLYNADVEYETFDIFTKQTKTIAQTIAYDLYDAVTGTFTYKYNSKITETYKETFIDWNKNTNASTTDYVSYKGSSKWHSTKFTQSVVQNTWYTARFWVEVPFKGTEAITGKYNVAVKPSNLILNQAVSQNRIVTLDPWYSASWLYRKSFTISHASGVLSTYQMPIKFYYGAGVDGTETYNDYTAGKVYGNSYSQVDFDDVRFTASDGTTLQDYWLETKVDSNYAIFWVELNNIGVGATTFYVYYGNTGVASTSSVSNTFVRVIDNCQRSWLMNENAGTDANDTSGGGFTATGVNTPTWTSGKFNYAMSFAAASSEYMTFSDNGFNGETSYTYEIWLKTSTVDTQMGLLQMGTVAANQFQETRIAATNKITSWYGGGTADSTSSVTDNNWYHVVVVNYGVSNLIKTFINGSYEVQDVGDGIALVATGTGYIACRFQGVVQNYYNGALDEVRVYSDNLTDAEIFDLANNRAYTTTNYVNNVLVKKFNTIEPAWGSWGSEENLQPTVLTDRVTGIGSTWAILGGNISSSLDTITTRGFDYGLTTSYGSSNTESGTYSTGFYSRVITGLTSGAVYHYRAKATNATGYGYGGDKMFATKGSPVIYEYYNTGDNNYWLLSGDTGIYANRIAYQVFTTNSTSVSHTVTSAKLLVGRVGAAPGDTIVSIRRTSGGVPTGDVLATSTLTSTGFSTTSSWQEFEFDEEVALLPNTKYAVCVRSPSSSTNAACVRWRWNANGNGDLFGGNAGGSTSGGVSWSSLSPADCMYELWGNYAIEVLSAKVATGYINTGDWLIVCHYNNVYPPYCPTSPFFNSSYLDVSDYFQLRLTSASGNTTIAQTKCAQWGYRPGSIYLSAASVSALTWGSAYRVQIYGTFSPYPYMEYSLTATDWLGSDLTRLDKYILSVAALMETNDLEDYLDYIGDKGQVINDTGNPLFVAGIPDLDVQRPNIFATVTDVGKPQVGTFTHGYQATLAWQTLLGPDVTDTFTSVGNTFSVDGMIIGAALFFILFAMIGSVGFMSGHGIAGLVVAFPIILAAVYVGLIGLVVLGIIVAIITFFFVWRTIFAGG